MELTEQRGLSLYVSSKVAERGFCTECGASLFWKSIGASTTSVAAGTIYAPTGLETISLIFVAHAGDYYVIDDDLAKHARDLGM